MKSAGLLCSKEPAATLERDVDNLAPPDGLGFDFELHDRCCGCCYCPIYSTSLIFCRSLISHAPSQDRQPANGLYDLDRHHSDHR